MSQACGFGCNLCGEIIESGPHQCSPVSMLMKLSGECAALRSERDEARELVRRLYAEWQPHKHQGVEVEADVTAALARWGK